MTLSSPMCLLVHPRYNSHTDQDIVAAFTHSRDAVKFQHYYEFTFAISLDIRQVNALFCDTVAPVITSPAE